MNIHQSDGKVKSKKHSRSSSKDMSAVVNEISNPFVEEEEDAFVHIQLTKIQELQRQLEIEQQKMQQKLKTKEETTTKPGQVHEQKQMENLQKLQLQLDEDQLKRMEKRANTPTSAKQESLQSPQRSHSTVPKGDKKRRSTDLMDPSSDSGGANYSNKMSRSSEDGMGTRDLKTPSSDSSKKKKKSNSAKSSGSGKHKKSLNQSYDSESDFLFQAVNTALDKGRNPSIGGSQSPSALEGAVDSHSPFAPSPPNTNLPVYAKQNSGYTSQPPLDQGLNPQLQKPIGTRTPSSSFLHSIPGTKMLTSLVAPAVNNSAFQSMSLSTPQLPQAPYMPPGMSSLPAPPDLRSVTSHLPPPGTIQEFRPSVSFAMGAQQRGQPIPATSAPNYPPQAYGAQNFAAAPVHPHSSFSTKHKSSITNNGSAVMNAQAAVYRPSTVPQMPAQPTGHPLAVSEETSASEHVDSDETESASDEDASAPFFDPRTCDFASLRWADLVPIVKGDPRFLKDYSFNVDKTWVRAPPHSEKKHSHKLPAVLGIDCEMCEAMDPVTGMRITNALIRFSVVNGTNPSEVLIDTLVAPMMVRHSISSPFSHLISSHIYSIYSR